MASKDMKEVGHFRSPIVEMPAPTAWPIVLAFGITLLFSGLVTNLSVSLLGVILTLAGRRSSRLLACWHVPGQPVPSEDSIRPNEVEDFNILYSQNCAGCHGAAGKGGAAIALADPVFLSIADGAALRQKIANGVQGTPMPAFAQKAGGMLTDKQVDVIAEGLQAWTQPEMMRGVSTPPYMSNVPGDPKGGATVYAMYCSSCHGRDGRGGERASSIVDPAYLALVSDQQLRTIVITGRRELGAPDWRGNVPGHPMSAQEISDVVAWLAGQRPRLTGELLLSPAQSKQAGERR
jgi:cytochrome c oxidase cbb3-type subunit III